MTIKQFEKYIKSIGFSNLDKTNVYIHSHYKKYKIYSMGLNYFLYIDDKIMDRYVIDDLRPLKQIEIAYKLKKILG